MSVLMIPSKLYLIALFCQNLNSKIKKNFFVKTLDFILNNQKRTFNWNLI